LSDWTRIITCYRKSRQPQRCRPPESGQQARAATVTQSKASHRHALASSLTSLALDILLLFNTIIRKITPDPHPLQVHLWSKRLASLRRSVQRQAVRESIVQIVVQGYASQRFQHCLLRGRQRFYTTVWCPTNSFRPSRLVKTFFSVRTSHLRRRNSSDHRILPTLINRNPTNNVEPGGLTGAVYTRIRSWLG